MGHSESISSNARSIADIERDMALRGFPEMELLWRVFNRSGQRIEAVSNSSIMHQRTKHMARFFGHTLLMFIALEILSVIGAYVCFTVLPDLGGAVLNWCYGVSIPMSWKLLSLDCLNSSDAILQLLSWNVVLFVMSLFLMMNVQRFVIWPFNRIMAQDLAFMLSRLTFRQWFDETPEAKSVVSVLHGLGVSDLWDNPNYRQSYVMGTSGYERVEIPTQAAAVLGMVRDFIGTFDRKRRRHVPGRYVSYLKGHEEGKSKSNISRFIATHQSDLDALKGQSLEPERARALLQALKDLVNTDSPGVSLLNDFIESMTHGGGVLGNAIQAEVWARDPWVDLTHNEEFYSSASLRGVKFATGGSQGRLGTFGYLRNKAICCLDFRTRKGRLVRARLGAATDKSKRHAVLFVDGVEGTNALDPAVVKRGIEDYAWACGFSFVVYNKYVLNTIPTRFVHFVARTGALLRSVWLEYTWSAEAEYLDAFGFPLRPFEYQRPRGQVIGYVEARADHVTLDLGTEAKRGDRMKQWLRINSSLLFALGGMCFGLVATIGSMPALVVPYVLFMGTLCGLHRRLQRKALKAVR